MADPLDKISLVMMDIVVYHKDQPINCKFCGDLEHEAQDCPTNRPKGPRCFACGLWGHVRRRCPNNDRASNRDERDDAETQASQSQADSDTQSEGRNSDITTITTQDAETPQPSSNDGPAADAKSGDTTTTVSKEPRAETPQPSSNDGASADASEDTRADQAHSSTAAGPGKVTKAQKEKKAKEKKPVHPFFTPGAASPSTKRKEVTPPQRDQLKERRINTAK